MHKSFNAPVIQEYAGVDFGQVGLKKGADFPFKIFTDYHIVEAYPRTNEAEIFDVGITTLYRRYTPLIKYRNGDSFETPVFLSNGFVKSFQNLHGRRHEAVQLNDKESVHSMAFLHCIHQEPSVMNIQLHLFDSGPKLLLATNSAYDHATEMRIRARLKQVSVSLENIPFEISSDVEVTVAGKRKWLQDHRTLQKF
jgi:phenylacetate-coenzyme A ligase PaaK-like adenylate-forming protein